MSHENALKWIATHSLIFFTGYWLAGGCEYRPDSVSKTVYKRGQIELQSHLENHQARLYNIEEKLGIKYNEGNNERR